MEALSLGTPFYHPDISHKSKISLTAKVDHSCITFMVGEVVGV